MAKCGKYQPVPPGSIFMVVENDPSSESKLDSTSRDSNHCFGVVDRLPNSLQVRLIRKSPSNSEHCRLLRLSLPTAPSLPLQELRHRHHRRRPRQHHHRHRRSPDMWFWAKSKKSMLAVKSTYDDMLKLQMYIALQIERCFHLSLVRFITSL